MLLLQEWAEDAYCKNEIIRHRIKEVIVQEQTPFQKVEIYDLYDYGLSLFIDGIPQSATKDEWIYHECLVHPAMVCSQHNHNFRVLVLGAGEGASLRELLKYDHIKNIDAIDVDRQAVQLFQKHLKEMHHNSYDHQKVNLQFRNAGDFLKSTVNQYDVIISDITDVNFFNLGAAEAREQADFYELIKKRLKTNGILAMHSSELTEIHYHKHLAMSKLLHNIFANVFSYRVYVPFFECSWGFLLATNDQALNPLDMTENQFEKRMDSKISLKYITPRNLRSIFTVPNFFNGNSG
ncbi:MAG: methyltransferase domain-containing protein [Candidatus Andersenbacteria bacterium]|nr:methyltransferase domain-containing protein [Candidatus Andersenbacteria bacterium]